MQDAVLTLFCRRELKIMLARHFVPETDIPACVASHYRCLQRKYQGIFICACSASCMQSLGVSGIRSSLILLLRLGYTSPRFDIRRCQETAKDKTDSYPLLRQKRVTNPENRKQDVEKFSGRSHNRGHQRSKPADSVKDEQLSHRATQTKQQQIPRRISMQHTEPADVRHVVGHRSRSTHQPAAQPYLTLLRCTMNR